jgi:competence protein ComEC
VIEPRLETAPLLLPAAAFTAGIAAAAWLPFTAPGLLAAAAVLLIAALASHRHSRAALVLVLAGVVLLGALRMAGPRLPADHLARRALDGTLSIEGRLADEPVRWTADRARLLLDVDAVHAGPERRPAAGRVQLTAYGELAFPLAETQRVLVDARLHRPAGFRNPGSFDYPAHLRREGILLVGHARADRITALTPDAPPWPVAVKRWAVGVIAARLPETSAALLAGLLLGERSTLPPAIDASFRRAGVYHILAVSGFRAGITAWLSARGAPAWLAAAVAVSLGAQAAVTPLMLRLGPISTPPPTS